MLQLERLKLYDPHQNFTLRKLRAMAGNGLKVHNLPLTIVHKHLLVYTVYLVLERLLPLWVALRNLTAFLSKAPCFLQMPSTPEHI